MSFSNWLRAGVLAWLPVAAFAQQTPPQADPDVPGAPVPVVQYQSALTRYMATPELAVTPDRVWRSANEEVMNQGAHAGHAILPASGDNPASPTPSTRAVDAPGLTPRADGPSPAGASGHQHGGH